MGRMGRKGKGTGSQGLHNGKNHVLCRRCNSRSYHAQKHVCSSCGYPAAKMRQYNWALKTQRRRAQGTGRMRTLKEAKKISLNGFRRHTVRSLVFNKIKSTTV